MDKGLMQKEPWENLGYGEEHMKTPPITFESRPRKEETGFIPGTNFRRRN